MTSTRWVTLALIASVVGALVSCDTCPHTEGIPEGQYRIINPPEALDVDEMTVTIEDGKVSFRYIDSEGVHDVEYLIVLPAPPPGG